MKIFVGPTACAMGVRFSKSRCPIALALFARGFRDVSVDLDRIQWGRGKSIRTPDLAQAAIMQNDFGQEIQPFTFEIPD